MATDKFREFDDRPFKEKMVELYEHLEINHMLFHSNEVDDNEWSRTEIDAQFVGRKYHHIEVNNVYTAFRKNKEDGNAYDSHYSLGLDTYWELCKQSLFPLLRETAEYGENKYELNRLLKEHIQFARKKIDALNLGKWIEDKDPNNKTGVTLLKVQGTYQPFIWLRLDPTNVLPAINHEFQKRRSILFDLLIELTEIYSEHLLLPTLRTLPATPFTHSDKCSVTDLYEIFLLMERYCTISDFEKFKAVMFEMLNIEDKKYIKSRSKIQHREKGTFSFLRKVATEVDGDR